MGLESNARFARAGKATVKENSFTYTIAIQLFADTENDTAVEVY